MLRQTFHRCKGFRRPLSTIVNNSLDDFTVGGCVKEPKVIIIGAGLAGLSAAQRLASAGFKDFTILEASHRVGGRIETFCYDNKVLEFGAQWFKTGLNNSIFNLAMEEQLALQSDNNSAGIFLSPEGLPGIRQSVGDIGYTIFSEMKSKLNKMDCSADKVQRSVLDYLNLRIQQELATLSGPLQYDVYRVIYGLTNDLKAEIGIDLSLASALDVHGMASDSGRRVTVPRGMANLLAPLLREIPAESVHYNKQVDTVSWGTQVPTSPRALLMCHDTSAYEADYVLVTVPLGVLKSTADTMFCPSLPSSKTEAIKALGVGHLHRVFMEYTNPFWAGDQPKYRFARCMDEVNGPKGWASTISRIDYVNNTLAFEVSGQQAVEMENCSNEHVAMELTNLLRQYTGNWIPFPSNLLRSRWWTNKFFRGAQSYLGMQSNVEHQKELGSPVFAHNDPNNPILLFAGEATSIGSHATLHGARTSGIREAHRILKLTKAQNKI
ncbi:uncharacterized protein LOC126844783 [Adelges cooleyi]|uniref:uncharacterized protein LOC126844783 n=1 Tax=Adelges cooleyi TaxID=133065 RepID=UPI00217F7A62|nr:uncharacterized protein LOC126844783 [Adelges cooleyi]